MGIKYIWDTNTVIYYLQQQFPPSAEELIDKLVNEARPVISAITEIELLLLEVCIWKRFRSIEQFH